MQTKKIWRIAHLGHLGVGSIFGMTTLGSEQNKYQEWLRECWDECKKKIGIPNVLILGGEILDGFNPKGYMEDIWLPRIDDQYFMAYSLIKEWIDPKITEEVLIPYGHKYHALQEIRIERFLANQLTSNGINAKAGSMFTRHYFGKTLRFRHGGSGAFVYLATSKEREIKFNLQQYALGKTQRFDQEYSYHTHQLYSAQLNSINAMSCPVWKLMDTYAKTKRPDAWLQDIGMVVTTFEERFGKLRINNDEFIYIPPFEKEDLEQAKIQNAPKARMLYTKTRMATTGIGRGGRLDPKTIAQLRR